MDGRTDRQTDLRVFLVNNCGSRNLLRRRSHCRAIVSDTTISHSLMIVGFRLGYRYEVMRVDTYGQDLLPLNTICSRLVNFLVSRLDTNRIVLIESTI